MSRGDVYKLLDESHKKEGLNHNTRRFVLVYDPTLNFDNKYSPVCYDGYIHLRLKHDFKVVAGCEDKLTYFFTLMINQFFKNFVYDNWDAYKPGQYSFDDIIKLFKEKDSRYETYLNVIRKTYPDVKGIKFLPAYKAKTLNSQLAFEFENDDNELKTLSMFGFPQYFFEDMWYLTEVCSARVNPNSKFIRKEYRKKTPLQKAGVERKNLWGD